MPSPVDIGGSRRVIVMTGTPEPAVSRAVSADGTEIGWVRSGTGQPLVLVHGMVSDHHRWGPLLPHLEPHVTVHAMDRRGRGLSGDGAEYGVVREFEDVAAVVDAVAEESGAAVDVYGHSSGGVFAFGAATLSSAVRKLVLYEGWPVPQPPADLYPPGFAEQLESSLEEGDREAVAETFFREVLAMPRDQFEAYRSQPSWRHRVAAAHTIPREIRTEQDLGWDPAMAETITVPVLLVVGGDSPDALRGDPEAVAAALPDARIAVVPGQGHVADVLAPATFAEVILTFLHGER
jgi:pimeloyl-ACP methyl ester carboxylesterase